MHHPPEPGEYDRLSYPLLPRRQVNWTWRNTLALAVRTFGPLLALAFWFDVVAWLVSTSHIMSQAASAGLVRWAETFVYDGFMILVWVVCVLLAVHVGRRSQPWEYATTVVPMRAFRPRWWVAIRPALQRLAWLLTSVGILGGSGVAVWGIARVPVTGFVVLLFAGFSAALVPIVRILSAAGAKSRARPAPQKDNTPTN